MSVDEILAQAGACVRTGQTLEQQGTLEAFSEAVKRYDEAHSLVRALPLETERVRMALAIASMNRGNALQKQNTPLSLETAVSAYDEAIALLRSLSIDRNATDRNVLGAAWMNRGHALLARGESTSIKDSLESFREAIAVLKTLPLHDSISFRVNLAAAWMNEANALMKVQDSVAAIASAQSAMAVTIEAEKREPIFADIGLKARRVACEALGHRLYVASQRGESTKEIGDQAIDFVDYIAVRLFHFGAQLYAVQLPDFLAEFILEHIDPELSVGAMADTEEFYLIASDIIARARKDLETRRAAFLDTPETARLLQRFRALRDAGLRLDELRARHLGARSV